MTNTRAAGAGWASVGLQRFPGEKTCGYDYDSDFTNSVPCAHTVNIPLPPPYVVHSSSPIASRISVLLLIPSFLIPFHPIPLGSVEYRLFPPQGAHVANKRQVSDQPTDTKLMTNLGSGF